jgi:hypothetical protein
MSPNQTPDDELARRLREALRQSEAEVDPMTAIRLRAARARAMDAAKPQRSAWLWAVPAATAATAVLVATLWLPGSPTPGPAAPAATESVALEALDVLADEQGPEFYQNLELYEWLEREAPSA